MNIKVTTRIYLNKIPTSNLASLMTGMSRIYHLLPHENIQQLKLNQCVVMKKKIISRSVASQYVWLWERQKHKKESNSFLNTM